MGGDCHQKHIISRTHKTLKVAMCNRNGMLSVGYHGQGFGNLLITTGHMICETLLVGCKK